MAGSLSNFALWFEVLCGILGIPRGSDELRCKQETGRCGPLQKSPGKYDRLSRRDAAARWRFSAAAADGSPAAVLDGRHGVGKKTRARRAFRGVYEILCLWRGGAKRSRTPLSRSQGATDKIRSPLTFVSKKLFDFVFCAFCNFSFNAFRFNIQWRLAEFSVWQVRHFVQTFFDFFKIKFFVKHFD